MHWKYLPGITSKPEEESIKMFWDLYTFSTFKFHYSNNARCIINNVFKILWIVAIRIKKEF